MDKSYKAIDVAQFVLDYYGKNGQLITNLVLQKVLFFIQWNYLKKKGNPIFEDKIEAWPFGPVVPNVYHECKTCGTSPITNPIGESINFNCTISEKILSQLIKYPPWQLVDKSHEKNKSWEKAMKQGGNGTIISWDSIKEDNYSLEYEQ